MRKVMLAGALALASLSLTACMVPNPFGGAPLQLTGNLTADMPGIQAYAADIKAGIAKDAAEVRAMFQTYCPTVNDINSAAQNTTTDFVVKNTNITQSAADKQLGNVQKSTALAATICAGGTASDVKTAFVNFAAAAKTVMGWINAAKTSG